MGYCRVPPGGVRARDSGQSMTVQDMQDEIEKIERRLTRLESIATHYNAQIKGLELSRDQMLEADRIQPEVIERLDKKGNIESTLIVYRLPSGILHREDGPASIHSDGTQAWFLNGQVHRIGGPAIIHPDGRKEYRQYGVPQAPDAATD